MADFLDLESLKDLLSPGITLQDVIDILQDDSEAQALPQSVYVEPPDPHVVTDEESGEEDEPGELRHLSGRQLLANVEVVYGDLRTNDVTDNPVVNTVDTPVNLNMPISTCTTEEELWKKQRLKKGKPDPYFMEGDIVSNKALFPSTFLLQPEPLSCVECFERFFTDDIFDYIALQTKNYALFKNQDDPMITREEIKCFFGFMILTGYLNHPTERSYWEEMPDLRHDLVRSAFRRHRMGIIKKYIHFADNHKIDKKDKIWKLRPLMDQLKKQCFQNFSPKETINYDESMIRFFGKHSLKQFLPGKPIRFGYKMWCMNTNEGYLLNFDLYQGMNPKLSKTDCDLFGKCAAPFIMMLKELPDDIRKLPYSFFFDNLFSGVNLFRFLKAHGYSATGTFRENRLPKSKLIPKKRSCKRKIVELPDKKSFKKLARGSIKAFIEKNDGIIFVKWKDNGAVSIGSTDYGVHPLSSVKRWSAEKKKNVSCDRPYVVAKYNAGMGGTDQMDANINVYRIGLRSKKFYWPVFTWLVDAMIQNAWLVYRQHQSITQLKFRREIAIAYLSTFATPKTRPGPIAPMRSRILRTTRFDNVNHLIVKIGDGGRWRCALESCSSRTRYMCEKCRVRLCVECFLPFHRS